MLTTRTLSLFARVAQNSSSNWASRRTWPPACRSRYKGSSSPALCAVGIKIRLTWRGRHGYAFNLDGNSSGGVALNRQMSLKAIAVANLRPQTRRKDVIRFARGGASENREREADAAAVSEGDITFRECGFVFVNLTSSSYFRFFQGSQNDHTSRRRYEN